MNLNAAQQQEALEQYLAANPHLNQPQQRPAPILVAANQHEANQVTKMDSQFGIAEHVQPLAPEQFTPVEGAVGGSSLLSSPPTLMLCPLEEDLAEVLTHSIQVGGNSLSTPENVFLQQLLRLVTRQNNEIAKLSKMVKEIKTVDVEIPMEPTVTYSDTQPQQLVFNPPVVESDDEEDTETPQKKVTKKRKPARRRRPKK